MGSSAARIVLASASPRRRDLLAGAGWDVVCVPSGAEEIAGGSWSAEGMALENARLKWRAVASHHDAIVLAADTVVWAGGKFYGKPVDHDDARRMLRELGGRTHEVVTGVVVGVAGGRVEEFFESTRVTFREIDEGFIEEYVRLVDPLDKAGGYAAQGDDGRLIAGYEGSLTNVIGLPMERLGEVLEGEFGVVPVPQRLQR